MNKEASSAIVTGEKTPILRRTASSVQNFDNDLKVVIRDLARAMQATKGIGIAAPQLGKSLRLFLIDKLAFSPKESGFKFLKGDNIVVDDFLAVVNPKLTAYRTSGSIAEEGCLSLPGQSGYVERAKKVILRAQLADGQAFKIQAKGLLARVIQHEYDHLLGILICDKFIRSV